MRIYRKNTCITLAGVCPRLSCRAENETKHNALRGALERTHHLTTDTVHTYTPLSPLIVSDSVRDLDTSSDAPSEVYRAYLKRYIEGGETALTGSILFNASFLEFQFPILSLDAIPNVFLTHHYAIPTREI